MANKAVLGVAATALAGYKLHELAKGYAVERELKKEEKASFFGLGKAIAVVRINDDATLADAVAKGSRIRTVPHRPHNQETKTPPPRPHQ